MDLAVFDQFQRPGYQNRVLMRGSWCTLPVARSESGMRIKDVRLDPGVWCRELSAVVVGRYRGARFWKRHGDWLLGAVEEAASASGGWLWQFNLSLILSVRDRLGIVTPVAVGCRPVGADVTERLVDVVRQYRARAYLSGQGGVAYTDRAVFDRFGAELVVSGHEPPTPDSIVTLLMDHPDPLVAVTR